MPSLKARIDRIKADSASRIPPEARAVMQQATRDLQAAGLVERAVKPGDPLPDVTLPDSEGRPVSLATRVSSGPAVFAFYRGLW